MSGIELDVEIGTLVILLFQGNTIYEVCEIEGQFIKVKDFLGLMKSDWIPPSHYTPASDQSLKNRIKFLNLEIEFLKRGLYVEPPPESEE